MRFPLLLSVSVFLLLGISAEVRGEDWPGKISLPKFPKKDPKGTFGELKVFDDHGSPIRTPLEDWAGARKRVKEDPAWREWLAGRRTEVDDWMARRHDHPDWIAGWEHNFVSPRDSTTLTFTPDEPGKETLSSPSDPKVQLTPKLHAAWVAKFRKENGDKMVEAARLYRLTGDSRYAKWAASQLDFYSDHREDWKLHNKDTVRIMWQSLDEAVVLIKWVEAARTLGAYVTPAQKEKWSTKLFLPEAYMLEKGFQLTHNIACWHRSAEAQTALYCGDEALWNAAVNGRNGIRNLVARGVTSDYTWFEQSLGYNGYVVRALMPFFAYALREGRGPGLRKEMEIVGNLPLSPLTMRFPTGQLPNPSEGGKPGQVPTAGQLAGREPFTEEDLKKQSIMIEAAHIFPTWIGLKLEGESRTRNWQALLDPLPIVTTAKLPEVKSRNMASSHMAILKSGPWQVYFHYGQLAGSHAQAEALNFEAFYKNVEITHDAGTTAYGGKLNLGYFRTAVAHNVPLLDGRGQNPGWQTGCWSPGRLQSFSPSRVAAAQPDYMPFGQAERTLEIRGDQLIDRVSVKATDQKDHQLGFVLNLQGKARLTPQFAKNADFSKTYPKSGFQHWTQVRSAKAHDHLALDVDFGGTVMRIEFDLPGEFTISHGTVPDCVPNVREAFYVETTGQQATLTTTIQPASAK